MKSIIQNRTFFLFFLGNIISLVAFGFNTISISWLVLEQTGSEFQLGKIMAVATVPGLIIALLSGYLIDKLNRKWLLVFLDLFKMSVLILFLVAAYFFELKMYFIYITVFLIGIGNALFWPTGQAFVQEIVNKNDFFNANKLLSASYQIGSIFGAGIGGIIVHYFNPYSALFINIFAYLISSTLISYAPFKHNKNSSNEDLSILSINNGIGYLKKRKDILVLTMTTILSDVAIWGSLSVLTISISTNIFNKGTWGYGVLDGFYGAGALSSAFLVGYLTQKYPRQTILKFFYLGAAFFLFLSSNMPNIFLASVCFLLMGFNNNSARILIRTILMENIPNNIMGRVQTLLGIYTRIMVVTSSLLCGYLIENISIDTAINFTCFHYLLSMIGTYAVGKKWQRSVQYLS